MKKFFSDYLISFYIILSTLIVLHNCDISFKAEIKPIGNVFPGKANFIKSETIILICSFETTKPNFNVNSVFMTWSNTKRAIPSLINYSSEQNVEKTYSKVNSTLKFYYASEKKHTGLYECTINVGKIRQTYGIFVTVLDIPRIKNIQIKYSTENLTNGNNLTLICQYDRICNNNYKVLEVWEKTLNNNIKNKIDSQLRYCLVDNKYYNFQYSYKIINFDSIRDSGDYKCTVKYINYEYEETVVAPIFVSESYINLKPNGTTEHFIAGTKISLFAEYAAYPIKPTLKWQKITDLTKTDIRDDEKFEIIETNSSTTLIIKNSTIEDTGNYTLFASMNNLTTQLQFEVFVKDKPKLFLEDTYTMKDIEFKIECYSYAFPKPQFKWEYIPCGIFSNWSQNCNISRKIYLDEFSITSNLKFKFNIIKKSEFHQIGQLYFNATEFGLIKCLAKNEIGQSKVEAKINIGDIIEPFGITEFNKTVNNKLNNLIIGEELSLECAALIYKYKENLNWLQNNRIVQNTTDIQVFTSKTIYSYRKTLKFININSANQGAYECIVYPIDSTVPEKRTILIEVHENKLWYYIGICIILLLITSLIILIIHIRREKMKYKRLKTLGMENFQNGEIESINPRLSIEEQSELLPYDNKFEFPEKRLKLGKILGYGAFGVVRQAVAKNIIPGERETIVAVKMAKNNNNESLKSLASELKIMIYIGKHLNIVNLLGASTQNIYKHELMVIVEFCHFGNIKKYLIENRSNFINQIDPKNGKINFDIQSQIRSQINDNLTEFSNSNDYSKSNVSNSESSNDSIQTDTTDTTTSLLKDLKNHQNNPISQHHYTLTTVDLIIWSYQVASGMDYLASRNVLHCDLAARNILLCNDNVVKICDFGLAKSMYNQNLYQKEIETRLPLKWLAIESMEDNTFSTQSDVWSFGITLWEIFSLGRIPYPGMPADILLLKKLQEGYRMERSEFATKELYELMLDCWNAVPEQRPAFSILQKRIGKMLQKDRISYYISMNEPYLRENSIYENSKNGKDYYNLINSPNQNFKRSSDNFNNERRSTEIQSGYLPMKSITNLFRKNISSNAINNRESLKTKYFKKNLIAEEILQKTHRIT